MESKQEQSSQQNEQPQGSPQDFAKIEIDLNKYRQQSPQQQAQGQQQSKQQNERFRPKVSPEEQYKPIPQQRLSEEELRRQAQEQEASRIKMNALGSGNFNYLDLFQNQMKQHRQAQNEFYNTQKQEEQETESKKPAFFRKQSEPVSSDPAFDTDGSRLSRKAEDVKAWQNLEKQMEMDFDPDSKNMEELREFFKISKDKNALEHMNEQMFEYLYERMKERQIKFYAFLNKEFNIMNYKSARCSYHCFDSTERPLGQVNECLKLCREGVNGCRDFALNLQRQAEQEVEKCQNDARNFKNLTDPVIQWISCYEKLILRFDTMEHEIKDEFSNFI